MTAEDDAWEELKDTMQSGFIFRSFTGVPVDSTKKTVKSPENLRLLVDIRIKDHDHCHNLCPFLYHRGSTTTCALFKRVLSRYYDDHERHKLCKEAQYVR